MKFEFSPGLLGYGVQGADGSAGISGAAIYFTDYDEAASSAIITDAINNDEVLFSSAVPHTKLPGGRTYNQGDVFVDKRGIVWEIDFHSAKSYSRTLGKLSNVEFFDTDDIETDPDKFIRTFNIYDATTNYIIDNVCISTNINYLSSPTKIYNISPKNFARIEFNNIEYSANNPFTLWSSGEIVGDDDHKAIALIRNKSDNTFRLGNAFSDEEIREVNLVFDVSSLRKNSTEVIQNEDLSFGEILSNREMNANRLFTGVFNDNPESLYAVSLTNTTIDVSWNLYDFTPDASVFASLNFYEISTNFIEPLTFHSLESSGNVKISSLTNGKIYGYFINISNAGGWIRNSVGKQRTCNGSPIDLTILHPISKSIDTSATGLSGGVNPSVGFETNSPTGWTVSNTNFWITCTPMSGSPSGSEFFDVSVSKNILPYSRTGYVYINSEAPTQTITITQDASLPYYADTITLSNYYPTVQSRGGPINPRIYVTASGSWTCSVISEDYPGMVDSFTASGSGSQNTTITLIKNYSSARQATLRFVRGSATCDLLITQDSGL